MLKKLFYYPSKNLTIAIPIVLVIGFLTGLRFDMRFMKDYILFLTFLMIYPTMIGFKLKEAVDLSHMKPVTYSLVLNFILIPLIAFVIGSITLKSDPELFVGLVMISLFPTSGMTISWTMISKGNVAAAIKITALSLILGSFLAPWYLLLMVGQLVTVDVLATFFTIIQVVILPLILGNITYKLILKKYTAETFNKKIKPVFPAASIWSMLAIVFISVSMKSESIVSNPGILLKIALFLVGFYLLNFLISTVVSKKALGNFDGYALVYGTVMRNLSIALGIAASSFGPNTALVVTIAFILQVQGAAWYGKLSSKYGWLMREKMLKTESPS